MELSNVTPEQAKALKEKLESMSPEELREFQKKQCIFCHIVSGRTSSKKIYEDDKALAILDINPANTGHMLLLPKEHYTIMPQIPEDIVEHLFMVTKALSHSVLRALQCQGTTIFVANGVAAGQKAQHFMIHIIPRMENDDVNLDLPENEFNKTDIETVQKRIVKKITKELGGKAEEKKEEEKKEEKPEKIIPKVMEAEFEEVEKPIEKTRENQRFSVSRKSKISTKPLKKKINIIKKKGRRRKQKERKPKKDKIDLDEIAKVLGVK